MLYVNTQRVIRVSHFKRSSYPNAREYSWWYKALFADSGLPLKGKPDTFSQSNYLQYQYAYRHFQDSSNHCVFLRHGCCAVHWNPLLLTNISTKGFSVPPTPCQGMSRSIKSCLGLWAFVSFRSPWSDLLIFFNIHKWRNRPVTYPMVESRSY